ncbi:EAL domain-containing protein [Marinobacteraceae bacterium S3BR75-40.1]
MSKKDSRQDKSERLHHLLDQMQQDEDPSITKNLRDLLHELQVYQIELEMQNQELLEAHQEIEEARNRYEALYDFAPIGYITTDAKGVISSINLTGAELLGYNRAELLGTPFGALLEKQQSTRYFAPLRAVRKEGAADPVELKLRQADQPARILSLRSHLSQEVGQEVYLSAFSDVTARQEAQDRLRQAARVFDSTLEAIVITNEQFKIITVNRAFTRITGHTEQAVTKHNLIRLFSQKSKTYFKTVVLPQLKAQGHWQGEIPGCRKDGTEFPAWGTLSSIRDDAGRVTNQVFVFSDITQIEETHRRLSHMAHHDPLTGLPNRLFFKANLEQTLKRAKRHKHWVALFYIDLDRFKTINDTLGHSAGDKLLSIVASRLQSFVREEDLVCRLGGDEFIVVLNDIDEPADAAPLAAKILALIQRPMQLNGKRIVTSASIGISVYPDDAQDGEDLTRKADSALYRAKEEGKNTYAFYMPELTHRAQRRLSIEQGISTGLASGQFQLFYQPQQCLTDSRLSGFEGLLRWQQALPALTEAKDFIHVAEESHLIGLLDEYALRAACEQAAWWKKAGLPPVRISVNLSPRSLFKSKLSETLKSLLEEYGIGPEWIELEVTERALQTGERFLEELAALKELGIMLAIDDFGTGYSCMASLKDLPIDRLKIDRSFVSDAPENPQDAAIVRAIIAMGHSLGLRVIGEGVETQAQRTFLQQEGCDEIQGFWYHRPLSAEGVLELMA